MAVRVVAIAVLAFLCLEGTMASAAAPSSDYSILTQVLPDTGASAAWGAVMGRLQRWVSLCDPDDPSEASRRSCLAASVTTKLFASSGRSGHAGKSPSYVALEMFVLFVVVGVVVAGSVLHYYRQRNAEMLEKGEHAYRVMRNCSEEEFLKNKVFLEKRGMLNPYNFYWPQRKAPGKNCLYASVSRNVPFVPEDRESLQAPFGKFLLATLRTHPVIVYHYHGLADGNHSSKNETLISEMCHNWFCDVPKSLPYRKYDHDDSFLTPYFVNIDSVFPTDVCAYTLTEDELEDTFAPDESEMRYDCQRMWEAEKRTYDAWDWDAGWFLFRRDCVNFNEAIIEQYHKLESKSPTAIKQQTTSTTTSTHVSESREKKTHDKHHGRRNDSERSGDEESQADDGHHHTHRHHHKKKNRH